MHYVRWLHEKIKDLESIHIIASNFQLCTYVQSEKDLTTSQWEVVSGMTSHQSGLFAGKAV